MGKGTYSLLKMKCPKCNGLGKILKKCKFCDLGGYAVEDNYEYNLGYVDPDFIHNCDICDGIGFITEECDYCCGTGRNHNKN